MRVKLHHTNSRDHEKAGDLRQQSSLVEAKLWFALRAACAQGRLKFRRQQPIHPFIADFACMKARLLIELDGDSHNNRQAYDGKRDAYLKRQGYAVLRISNGDIADNLPSVVETIISEAWARMPDNIHTTPSPVKAKDLLRKSKLSLPLPQGERKKV